MNEITRNLWIGDLPSALNIQQLRKNKIHSVLSVMQGKLKINETFIRHQIELDDTQEADILSHFLPAIRIIGGELEKGRGVLVHCQAGISRSPTIVAAYLIYTFNITPNEALDIILEQRPFVQPNSNFSRQLDLFHNSQGKISRNDKDIRRFYLERTVHEVMSGDGSRLTTEMLSSFPNPSGSKLGLDTRSTSTSTASTSRRQKRIRCKMCRQDLATRDHMLDHGQLEPSAEKLPHCRPPSDHHSSDATTSQEINTACDEESASDRNAKPVSTMANTDSISANNIEGTLSDSILATNSSKSDPTTRSDSIDRRSPIVTTTSRLEAPSDLVSDLTALQIRSPSPSSESSQPNPDSTHLSLINPKCSGYFVEPMKWMDHFLSAGSLAGKITCPNKKCNSKLGNYDWAGVCCGCKIWVTPGFCINRSKVDEVV